jgi:hypothetical protein
MSANATCDVQRCPAWRQSSGVKRTSAGDCRPMAISKLQHCYRLLSSPAEKLLCARLMQYRAEGDRRGKGWHGCHMNHNALTARSQAFFFGCTRFTTHEERRRAAIMPTNANPVRHLYPTTKPEACFAQFWSLLRAPKLGIWRQHRAAARSVLQFAHARARPNWQSLLREPQAQAHAALPPWPLLRSSWDALA